MQPVLFDCLFLLSSVLTTGSDLKHALGNPSNTNLAFEVEGDVTAYRIDPESNRWNIGVKIGEFDFSVYELSNASPHGNPTSFRLNDRVRLSGRIFDYHRQPHAGYEKIRILAHRPFPPDANITPRDMFKSENLRRLVGLKGVIRDVFRDESDPRYVYLSILHGHDIAHVMLYDWIPDAMKRKTIPSLESQIGKTAIVHGMCVDSDCSLRKHAGRILSATGRENLIITTSDSDSATSIPELEDVGLVAPSEFAYLGRHQVSGRVLASWNENAALIRTDKGNVIGLRFLTGGMPNYGTRIKAIGIPQNDLFFLNLNHASWSQVNEATEQPDNILDTTPRQLLFDQDGHPRILVKYHGKTIRTSGTIRHLPAANTTLRQIQLESDGILLSIDVSANVDILEHLTVGSKISVTGTCVIDIENQQQDGFSPRIKGLFVVPRSAADIQILQYPSWWTPIRLFTVIGALAIGLTFILVWNIALRRRAERRGRELAAEQLAHVTSELKVSERTRLAVELHDALSQTLTGVSMQIDTAAGFAEGKMPAITKCLDLASRTIDACRMELRNTLWDLRSAALDEPSMDAAILKTLCQNLAGIDLSVRFNVPRETFSDNTAHAILRIIRELATNALRHGKATSLKIAGTIDGDKLLFSVRDNGCGFDPDLAPGISQGHFGLQGIAERLERLYGEMKIESSPGKGAKVTVTLPIPRSGE